MADSIKARSRASGSYCGEEIPFRLICEGVKPCEENGIVPALNLHEMRKLTLFTPFHFALVLTFTGLELYKSLSNICMYQ